MNMTPVGFDANVAQKPNKLNFKLKPTRQHPNAHIYKFKFI